MTDRSLRHAVLLASLLVSSCGGEGSPDAGPDAPAREDLILEATADPDERDDCSTEPPAAGIALAKHIVCPEELLLGSLAMGRTGDILLENARVRFVVRTGDESASTIGAYGGGLIDGALRGHEDLLKEIFPLFDLVSMRPTAIEVVDAGGDEEARVRVLFEDAPIELVETVLPGLGRSIQLRGAIDYVLRADAYALDIEMRITTAEGVSRSGGRLGVLALLGGVARFQPGFGVLDDDHLGGPGDTLLGQRGDTAVALRLDAEGASLTAAETIHLFRGARSSIFRGAMTEVHATVGVGTTAAEAWAAARPSPEPALTLRGRAGDGVTVSDTDGVAVARSEFDDRGLATFFLPSGSYRVLQHFGVYDGPATEIEHTGEAADEEVALPPVPAATFTLDARVDGESDIPVRVTIERDGEEAERFVAVGATSHRVAPGEMRVTVSHGLEFDVSSLDLTLGDGASATLEPALPRRLDTDGWVGVDLHLHSELSTDSVHPVEDAVRMLAAEGVQAASSSDHDYITDYAAVGERAGVDLLLVSGAEASTTVFGHINGYPLVPDPSRAGAGAPTWFEMSPAEVFAAMRALGDPDLGGALVQINHPRFGSDGFFDAVGLDRATGRALGDPTVLDLPDSADLDDFGFEVIEVFNGCCRTNDDEVLEDYLALHAAGRRFTMVGNSDSHGSDRPPGSPRSFVRVGDESAFSWADIAAGLRAGDVTVAGGIFVTGAVEGPVVGDTVSLRVHAQAPPWVATDRLRVYAGRELVVDRVLGTASNPRLDEVIDIALGGADFVLVRVDGADAPDPMQHFPPYGVTNAIVVRP